MSVKVGGVWRDTKAWWVKVGGVWREGSGVFTKVAGVWREEAFVEPLTAIAAPDDLFASGGGFAQTGNCTCTPTGGVAPYTFAWEKVSGTTLGLTGSTSATTRFNTNAPFAIATYRCKVTDDDNTIAFSNNVTVELDNM